MSADFDDFINKRRLEALARIGNVPIAVLIWGPAPSSGTPVALTRVRLREELAARGHHARFSEDLFDPNSQFSVLAQQVAQAEAFDIVVSIPDSPGSIAEIHDFSRIPALSHKVVAYLNAEWNSGYSNQTLIQAESPHTCRTAIYQSLDLPGCIVDPVLTMIRRLQEFHYVNGRRF
jgi:hypothetical protein